MDKLLLLRHLTLFLFVAGSCEAMPSASSDQDLYSLSLEDLLKLEVHPRQPYRGDAPPESLPQAVEILTDSFLQDVGVSTFQDALDYSSDVVRQNSFGNTWNSFAIRGFAGDENLPSGYFVNGFSAGRGFSGLHDTSNIQEIEILKGAGAALYGRSEPGGTINIITKKPKFEQGGYIQVSADNYDTYRLEGDYTSAATTSLALRVNGAYEEGATFRDTVETQKLSLNPSLLFRISEQTHFIYEMEILEQEIPFDRGIVVVNNDVNNATTHRFYGEPNDGPMKISAIGHQLSYEQNFSSQWNFLAGLGYRTSSLEGYSTEPELSATRQLLFSDGETLNRQRRYRDFDATDFSSKIELSGKFQVVGLVNHLLLGMDNYQYELTQTQNIWRVAPGDTTFSVDIKAPVYGQPPPALKPFWDLQEQERSTGGYLQDQIDLNKHWKLLAGFRYDDINLKIENFLGNSTAHQQHYKTTPHIGMVYETSPLTSVYINYSEGFRPNSGANWKGDAFEPENSRSYEIGSHINSPYDNIKSSIAFFSAGKSNILTADPINRGYSLALGKAESQGVEFNIDANLGNETQASFTYAYVDAHTSNDMTNPDWGVEIPKGSRLINIPKHKANFTLRKKVEFFEFKNNIGFSVAHVGNQLGETRNPDYMLPSYTTVRLFSSTEISDSLRLSLTIDNILNKKYSANSYSELWTQPGSPRTIRLTLRYGI